MRWSYKTVHFALKKEGILGSSFLDEPAIELSLNQYGKAGWELISLLETMDGLIAVFKQPLDLDVRSAPVPADAREMPEQAPRPGPAPVERRVPARSPVAPSRRPTEPAALNEDVVEAMLLDDFEVVEDKVEEPPVKRKPAPTGDIGMIRIE